jgi:hypothetical protein
MHYGAVTKSQPDSHMTVQRPDDTLRPGLPGSASFRRLAAERDDSEETLPSTGTVDDDDDPNDEHKGENEAPERGEEDTELPEEFETDDEDDRGHPEDDDADEDDEEDKDEDE